MAMAMTMAAGGSLGGQTRVKGEGRVFGESMGVS
jgi:hypothetical protein